MKRNFSVSRYSCLAIAAILLLSLGLYQLWGVWPSLVVTSIQWQREVNAQLADLLYDAKNSPVAVGSYLVGFSFLYGMLHSLGPGHGKVIVTTYLATHPTKVKMSLVLTVISALVQAIVAILLVSVLLWGFHASMREVNQKAMWLISTSYAFVTVLGALICWKAVKQTYQLVKISKPKFTRFVPLNSEDRVSYDQCSANSSLERLTGLPLIQPQKKCHSHSQECGCGHQHVVDASALNNADTWREYIGIVATIGIRPCTGAIMVLLFANVVGLYWMGVLSAIVMAAGTAFTTSMIAILTLTGKHIVRRYLKGDSGNRFINIKVAGSSLQFLAGVFLVIIGLILFSGQDYGMSPVFTLLG
ncbi:nickel/cobalt transporter [Vibrio sp. LaRot3]|uniref:nickel/cobalt transporter n=1 Tax=Vibrio sp. LaRot3 TaxID=2998829 RepID=UPI0022CE1F14|nr:nickel/cobalt transporter [Vibrio sp. LaRot3]MDA0150105.1 nickel/cobalt transporter [Vibrio sp. LaRot3]